jgi:hypothetical protein
MTVFMNGVVESVFSSSTPEHKSIQTYGHVAIVSEQRHVDFGSKLPRHGPNMSPYILYVGGLICKGPLHATTQVAG